MSKLNVILASSATILALEGCATSMRMDPLPLPGDSTTVAGVKVRVVDLDVSKTRALPLRGTSLPPELLERTETAYKVGPYDVLIVTVWEHPELTQPLGQYRNDLTAGQLVDAEGTMYFPYVGRVKVAGLSASEIQKLVSASLSKVLRDPQVDIKIAGYRSQRIYISGEVRVPGIQAIDDVPMTLPEAINRAGGILPTGDITMVRLTRGKRTFELNLDALQRSGVAIDSIQLRAGDQIRIPNFDERVAYVLGEVARPSVLRMTSARMSLLRGLTEAGGMENISANAAGVYVVRSQDSANVTVFRLDGRSPVALAWAGQFEILPRDLIYVDQSGLSRWSRVFQLLVPMSTVLSNTTGAAENIRVLKTQPW